MEPDYFTYEHCIDGGGLIGKDYEDAVLVLSLDSLNENCQTAEHQLFYSNIRWNEFLVGCNLNEPASQKVVYYQDVLGVLKPEHLPQWAVDALEVDDMLTLEF